MAAWLASTVVSAPFSSSQPLPIEEIVNRADVSLHTLVGVALVNGNYEEIFLLGFLVRGLSSYGTLVAVGVSLGVRVLYHLYQGPVGALSVFGFGLVLSIYYVRTRALFPVIFAHVFGDILPFLWRGAP
jgi:membrane protease YdiL (CAAX protease family)